MTLKNTVIALVLLLLGFTAGTVLAKSGGHSNVTNHGSHGSHSNLKEGGQAAFSAIAEIIGVLNADPETDWSKVNVQALRDHLADMNALTLLAEIETSVVEGGIRFTAKGTGTTLRALKNMVPAHARELNKMDQWSAVGHATDTGAELIVSSNNDSIIKKIEGLGFFGLMATGAHHQRHHRAMAMGKTMH